MGHADHPFADAEALARFARRHGQAREAVR